MTIQGRVAVVTGSASGIGLATTRELRRRGWLVGGLDRSPSPECHAWLAADVTDHDGIQAAVDRLTRALGPIDAIVSVAGHYEMTPISDISPEAWTRMLRVHVGGFLALTHATLPGMLSRGAGSIVAITSELAIGGGDGDAHYAAAKGTLIGIVRSLAVELAPSGIRVNGVAPGPTDTPLLAQDSPWRAPDYLATLPAGRLGRPEEVAVVVAFLLDEGSFCVGEVLSPNVGAVI